jgi:exosortase
MLRMMQPAWIIKTWDWRFAVSPIVALTMAILAWVYWPILAELAEEWSKNPLYSHGYLVPVFAAVLLWIRRDRIPRTPLQPSWWALAFLTSGSVMLLGAAYFYFAWPERGSLLFMIFGVVLAIGGWAAIRWTWPSILFLVFMIPLPGTIENDLMGPLQRVATLTSTNVLQTLGFFAKADGNVIVLSEPPDMNIAEACSGLRMLSTFVALTVGACFFMQRPNWQKLVIVASSIPIALLCNVVRISATGVLQEIAGHDIAMMFHDERVSAPVMMVLALLLLLGELRLLDFVFIIEPAQARPATSEGIPSLGQGHSPA